MAAGAGAARGGGSVREGGQVGRAHGPASTKGRRLTHKVYGAAPAATVPPLAPSHAAARRSHAPGRRRDARARQQRGHAQAAAGRRVRERACGEGAPSPGPRASLQCGRRRGGAAARGCSARGTRDRRGAGGHPAAAAAAGLRRSPSSSWGRAAARGPLRCAGRLQGPGGPRAAAGAAPPLARPRPSPLRPPRAAIGASRWPAASPGRGSPPDQQSTQGAGQSDL
jgi:hypothetical protein